MYSLFLLNMGMAASYNFDKEQMFFQQIVHFKHNTMFYKWGFNLSCL